MSQANINHHNNQQQLSYLIDDNMYLTNFLCQPHIRKTILDNSEISRKYSTKVFVKSSAHVSYIVGKQGAKIRQIRQETGTFIQTPVNGEDPVFIISGDRQKVNMAKAKLEEAANEFDFNVFVEACTFREGDKIRNNLFLPARYIGLVVGKKGSIIKQIMELSGTTIITPKVNTLNGFKIYGTSEEIRQAIDLIKNHIISTSNVIIEEVQQNQVEVTLIIKDIY